MLELRHRTTCLCFSPFASKGTRSESPSTMKTQHLVVATLSCSSVGAFLPPPVHVAGVRSRCGCSHTRMAALDFSACPVNTPETLKRTTDLSLVGMGTKKKLALLGSTVRLVKDVQFVARFSLGSCIRYTPTIGQSM